MLNKRGLKISKIEMVDSTNFVELNFKKIDNNNAPTDAPMTIDDYLYLKDRFNITLIAIKFGRS